MIKLELSLAPVVLFVYNRPRHAEETLKALAENELAKDTVLYIYADGPKKEASELLLERINETRELVKRQQGFKEVHIIEADSNKGLATSVIEGVTQIVSKYGKVIVLEDDLITSKGFLKYMNDALARYDNAESVMQVSGHCFPLEAGDEKHSAFFIPFCTSWGWATWKRSWDQFDPGVKDYELLKSDKLLADKFNLDGSFNYSSMLINQMETKTIDSWAIRWWWTIFRKNGLTLFPDKSLVENIGFGGDGTHTHVSNPFLLNNFDQNYVVHLFPNDVIVNMVFFNKVKKSIRYSSTKQPLTILRNPFRAFVKRVLVKLDQIFNR
jgi:hypothetical protein